MHIKNKIVFIIVILFLTFVSTKAQDSRGRDFILTFLPNYHQPALETYDSLSIYISGEEGTKGNIYFKDFVGSSFNKVFEIPPSGVFLYQLYWKDYELQGFLLFGKYNPLAQNNRLAQQSFRITSDRNVSVYALNKTYKSSDATIVFPVNTLGKEYIIASYYSNEQNYPNANGIYYNTFTPSEFAVVATQNDTHIEIYPSATTYIWGKNQISTALDSGDVFLVQTKLDSVGVNGDLTGTYVTSDKPIAVFGGHQRALIPNSFSGQLISRDQIYEQMLPIEALGKTYIIAPFAEPNDRHGIGYDVYRIIAAYDSTSISVNGVYKGLYKKGTFYESILDKANIVTASKDVLAVQYKQSTGVYDTPYSFNGDPFMLVVPPKKQFLKEYITYNIQAQENNGYSSYNIYEEQYVTVIAPKAYVETIQMDGKYLNSRDFRNIGNSCYAYAYYSVKDGAHKFKGDIPFGVYIYGYGGADSYGYNGGMSFKPSFEIIPEAKGDVILCPGDTTTLTAMGCVEVHWSPEKYLDNPDSFSPRAFPKKTTWFEATMSDSLGCIYKDSVKVTIVPSALIKAGPDTSICEGSSAQLYANGGVSYKWSADNTLSCTDCRTPIAMPKNTRYYYVYSKDVNGCNGWDSVLVTVNPLPIVDAGKDTVFCLGHSIELRPNGADYYEWEDNSTLSCSQCDNPIATPKSKTTYHVKGYNKFKCFAKDSITIDVFPSSILDAGADTSICYGTEINLKATGGDIYLWDYDPSLSDINIPNPKVRTYENRTYYVTSTDTNGCIGRDSVRITVLPDYQINICNDTTVCKGEKVILKASGAKKYFWSPSQLVVCDTCSQTETIIAENTKFYLTTYNENDCIKYDSVEVNAVECALKFDDVVFPLNVYCDIDKSTTAINNIGELALRIDSLILKGNNKDNFKILLENVLPKWINKGEKYNIDIEFTPDEKNYYSAYLIVYTNIKNIDTIFIQAFKRNAKIQLDLDFAGGSEPGDSAFVKLSILSEEWERIHLKKINVNLRYNYRELYLNRELLFRGRDLSQDWLYKQELDSKSSKEDDIWTLSFAGDSEISKNTTIFFARPIYLLHPDIKYDIKVFGTLPEEYFCSTIISDSAEVYLSYCVDTLRAIEVGEGKYDFRLKNNQVSNEIEISIYLPINSEIEFGMIDILGRQTKLYNAKLLRGKTEFISDISSYSKGVYMVYMKTSNCFITRKILIDSQ